MAPFPVELGGQHPHTSVVKPEQQGLQGPRADGVRVSE